MKYEGKILGMDYWTDESVPKGTVWLSDKSCYENVVMVDGALPPKPWKQKEDTMTGKLYWVVLVKNPTKKEKEDSELSTIVVEPTPVIARDEGQAIAFSAKKWADKMDKNTEVVVVPFD